MHVLLLALTLGTFTAPNEQAVRALLAREAIGWFEALAGNHRDEVRAPDGEGATARRVIELVFVQTAFYLPREFEARGERAMAAALREVSNEIHPGRLAPRSQ